MGQIDDINASAFPDILRRLRALEFASNQNNMAVGRGGIRVHSGGVITVENGGLKVTGSAEIIGELIASGTISMSGSFTATGDVNLNGPVGIAGDTTITGDVTSAGHFIQTGLTDLNGATTIAGDTTVTGDFDVNGPMKTTGTLSVEGVTTLKNDLNVTTGKINAGGMTIDPSVSGGALKFSGGSVVAESVGSVVINAPSFIILNTDTKIAGNVFMDDLPTTTQPANLRVDPTTGALYRVV